MNRLSTLAAALLLSLTLAACGGGGGGGGGGGSSAATSSASSASTSAVSSSSSEASSAASSESSSVSSSASSSTASTAVTLHMLGDSTMTNYAEDRRPQMGWGEAVQKFFDSNSVTVKNWATGGRSSRSFYYETGKWDSAKAAIQSGDYVIIQFGHNDQKYGESYDLADTTANQADRAKGIPGYGTYAYCSDGTTNGETCSDVEHSYYQYLKKYVAEIKAKGANPILMTPIVRNYQEGGDIRADGQHNFSAKILGSETNPRGNYVQAMKDVATTYNVPLVDLTAETRTIVLNYGASAATSLYIAADSTHPQVLFANLIAKKAVEGMSALNILKDRVVAGTSLITSPTSLDWGNRYIGVPQIKSFMAAAFDLSPAADTATISSPDAAYQLSSDQSSWSSSLQIPYTNAAFTETVYVRFTPAAEKDYAGNLSIAVGSATLGTLAVSGKGVAAGSGMASYSRWFTAGSSTDAVIDGLLTADAAAAYGAGLTPGNAKAVSIDGQDTSVARYYVNTWAERDATRYLEFVVTPTGKFSIETISAVLLTSGTGNVKADIEYSVDGTNWVKLNSTVDLPRDSDPGITKTEYTVTASVASAVPFKVRVYPWMVGASGGGRYLGIYDLKVSGKVE